MRAFTFRYSMDDHNWLIIFIAAGVGAILGGTIGFVLCAMLSVGRNGDDEHL